MRPLRLQLRAFTAFRDEQEIDFTDLDLFALCGPIGSGKSSILDAITYALYGYVERVGNQTSQLISQGQPRMAATLDFKVGPETLRVSRTTLASGTSKALLEILDGADWRSYGPGADSIREVNRLVVEIVGLDYDAFTRSVVLPQGKFAQFLVGDPAKRREILIELLGLQLFEKMAKRSNEIASEAKHAAQAAEQMLERRFAHVSAAALEEARREAKAAADRVAHASEANRKLEALADDIRSVDVAAGEVSRCVRDIGRIGSWFVDQTRLLERQMRTFEGIQEELAALRVDEEKAADALGRARRDVEEAEQRWGTREDLAALREQIVRLEEARTELTSSKQAVAATAADLKKARAVAAAAEDGHAAAGRRTEETGETFTAMKRAHEQAHRHDLVGALVAELGPGAPCPVCERPLDTLPAVDASALRRATAELKRAEKAHEDALAELVHADKARALAVVAVETAEKDCDRCAAELSKRDKAFAAALAAVSEGFGGEVPDDAPAATARRLAELDDLMAARETAAREHEEALRALRTRELAAHQATTEIEKVKAAIAHPGLDRLIEDVRMAAPQAPIDDVLTEAAPDDAKDVTHHSAAIAQALGSLRTELESNVHHLTVRRAEILERARAVLPQETEATGEMEDVIRAARALLERTREDATRRALAADKMSEELQARNGLETELAAKRYEHELYRSLGLELRSNRIVDYLQAGALAVLAEAGSRRLGELSGTRYRLAYEDDRFFVVDAWNGDERRSVKTLSGGETFLASLALALALAEQVQQLAVTERHRLESLFLDEGFGSLDAETLELVVAAIEQLGGDDRLVGVITHVTEVADRMPVRIEVRKSPRGSKLGRSVKELAAI